jgi:hypothetical protein
MMNEEEYEINTELLDEAYKNVRMASFAIDCIIDKIENKSMEDLLRKQNVYYLDMVEKLESLSEKLKHKPKDINIMLKGMSFASIKTKTMMNNETSHLAEMLVQGTTMGITDTIKAKSEYPTENHELNNIVDSIISHEEKFVESLKDYL